MKGNGGRVPEERRGTDDRRTVKWGVKVERVSERTEDKRWQLREPFSSSSEEMIRARWRKWDRYMQNKRSWLILKDGNQDEDSQNLQRHSSYLHRDTDLNLTKS